MKENKKVLFVTRDKKPGMIATRIARVLQAQGAEIRVVAEGLSLAEWKSTGFDNCIVAEGPLDIKESWGISAHTVLSQVRPSVVVVGLSSPIRSEAWFASAARPEKRTTLFAGIPLVALDDNWGSIFRCKHSANLVLTCDELGKRLIAGNLAYAHHDYKVEIIGDLSATAATEQIPQATIDAFNKVKGDAEYAFILASQKWPESDDIIEIALSSCELSLKAGAKLVVIPRIHPGAKPEDRERWNTTIVQFSERFPDAVKILGDSSINTDHLATLADGTFAATGSVLRAAAFTGKIPLCVWTQRLGEKLKAESGMEHHPLVMGDCMEVAGQEVTKHTDVIPTMWSRGDLIRANQKKLLTPVPFDAEKAANAILAIAK